jgi:hypothetical protein
MKIAFNLFVSLVHFLLTYSLFLVILLSKNIHHLIVVLVVLLAIRFSYSLCGRCILSLAEENEYYPILVNLFSNLITQGLDDKLAEEIIINVGLLSVINKLGMLYFLEFWKWKQTDK